MKLEEGCVQEAMGVVETGGMIGACNSVKTCEVLKE